MTSLNGLRFLSIFWILLGHTYYMKAVSPNVNSIVVKHVGNIHSFSVSAELCVRAPSSLTSRHTPNQYREVEAKHKSKRGF
jgi:hypothetical protein